MTLKKSKNKRAQAIFEYFILTAVVVTAVLFFGNSVFFNSVRGSCIQAFDQAVRQICEGN